MAGRDAGRVYVPVRHLLINGRRSRHAWSEVQRGYGYGRRGKTNALAVNFRPKPRIPGRSFIVQNARGGPETPNAPAAATGCVSSAMA